METVGGSGTLNQTFNYDRYRNRKFDEANTSMPASFANPPVTNPSISPNSNRITSAGWGYDAAGNTLTDAGAQTYVYDGENKMVKASNGGGTLGEYFYDGDGKRVKKIAANDGGTTIFVYDAAGKLVAEYSQTVASVEDAKVAYLTNDHLGSPRINTDRDGNVTARHDYHPFGEEIVTTQRTGHSDYTPDSIRKQFTGYERDGETELDFAQARSYNFNYGRFTSPDDFLNVIRPADTQNFNLYTYVSNNPLRYIDPDGEIEKDPDGKVRFDEKKKNGKKVNERRAIWKEKLKDGRTLIVSAVYTMGNIYTDKGNAVGAMKLDEEEDIKLTITDKDGGVSKEQNVSKEDLKNTYKMDAGTNCFGSTFAQGEVWILNEKGSVNSIIQDDGYKEDVAKVGSVGLYFSSDKVDFSKVEHAVTVTELGSGGKVSSVMSKNGSTLAQQAAPGPGPNSAWDKNSKLRYFSQNTSTKK